VREAETKTAQAPLRLQVSRLLPAPPARVWRAWTEPGEIERWWHPAGFRRPACERLDLRVGGGFRIVMPAEDGAVYTAWGIYREIVPERKLAYEDRCDRDGRTFHAASVVVTFAPEGPAGTLVTVATAIELDGYAGTQWTPPAIAEGWTKGWQDNLAGLAACLSASAAAGRPADDWSSRE